MRLNGNKGLAALVACGAVFVAGCGSGNSLDSQTVHDNLVKKLQSSQIGNLDPNKLADCAIGKLKAEGYKNEGDVPAAKASKAGQDCANEQLQTQGG